MDSSPPSFPSKFAYQMQFEQKVNAATPVAVPIAVAGGHAVAHAVPIAVAAPIGGGGDHADATRQFLASEGFPRGLAEQVLKTKETFPLRYWVVDNSGSMGINDGMKVKKRGQAPVQCTRWEELQVMALLLSFPDVRTQLSLAHAADTIRSRYESTCAAA